MELAGARALPIDNEPWAEDVATFFERTPNDNPFIFIQKRPFEWRSNKRYMQWKSDDVFEGLEWPIADYSVKQKIPEDEIQTTDLLVYLANRGQLSFTYTPPDSDSIRRLQHFRKFTTQSLRYMRAIELLSRYQFNPIELAIYGGWKTTTVTAGAPDFVQRLIGIGYDDPNFDWLQMMAEVYFRKLLH